MKIGVVCSEWNRPVTEKLEQGAVSALKERGIEFKLVNVPGAFEIPLIAQEMLQQDYAAVVALGAVIRGETTHYDYVCNSVERGCTELQLKFAKPVGFGVVTTENAEQAFGRAGGKKGNKGAEAVETVLTMLEKLKELR